MTEQLNNENNATPLLEEAPTETDPTAQPDDLDTIEDTPDKGNREAAKYRRQLRDVEAQRDSLQAQLESSQKEHISSLIRDHGFNPDGVLLTTPISEFLTPEGAVSAEQVKTLTDATVKQLGLTKTQPSFPKADPSQGGSLSYMGESDSWGGAFSPQSRS